MTPFNSFFLLGGEGEGVGEKRDNSALFSVPVFRTLNLIGYQDDSLVPHWYLLLMWKLVLSRSRFFRS